MTALDWMKRVSIATAVAASSGCVFGDDDDDRPERPGELGTGTFRYICVGDSDPYCENGFVAETFPERFAVGGAFDLDFDPTEFEVLDGEPLPRVIAGSPDSVHSEAMAFSFARPGYAAFLARNTIGEVVDLKHFYGAAVERIAVTAGDSQELAELGLLVGDEIDLRVEPQDSLRSVLAGSLTWEYAIDDPAVAEVLSTDNDRDVSIRAVGPGATTLHVIAGGFDQIVSVSVAGAPATTGEEPPAESDGSTGGG